MLENFLMGCLTLLVITEGILWLSWFKWYFSKGIIIYRKEINFNGKIHSVSKDELIKNIKIINFTFKQADDNTVFFREKLFIFSISPVWEFINYIPIMRGMLKLDTVNNKHIITGFLNYSILTILIVPPLAFYISLFTGVSELFLFFSILIIFFAGILIFTYYVLQLPKYNKIARYLENKSS